jgi:hypothetical protein
MIDEKLREFEAALAGVPVCNENWNFYYDESGNCRKLYLRDGTINSLDALKYDFILGGVMTTGGELDISKLKSLVKLQSSAKEFKFKHLYGSSKNFLDFMSKNKTTQFLEWLYNSDSYVHFSCNNNWFYTIVDLVDELFESHPVLFNDIGFLDSIKTAVFRFTKRYQNYFISLFFEYDYPNVPKEKTKEFCLEISDFIKCNVNNDEYEETLFLETFRQAIKAAGKSGEITFGINLSENSIIESYTHFYIQRCNTFAMSKHIFDKEPYVEKRFKEIIKMQTTNINYDFVDSKCNEYVQLADVVVGFLSELFFFLDNLDYWITLSDRQKHNFDLIWKIIMKSNDKYLMLIHNLSSRQIVNDRWGDLQFLSGNLI